MKSVSLSFHYCHGTIITPAKRVRHPPLLMTGVDDPVRGCNEQEKNIKNELYVSYLIKLVTGRFDVNYSG